MIEIRYGIVIAPQDYAKVCESGYDYIELAGRTIAAMTDAEFDDLKDLIHAGKLPCLGLNAYCPPEIAIIGKNYSHDQARMYAIRLAQRAHALGVKKVGIGSPSSRMLTSDLTVEGAWKQAEDFMRLTSLVFASYDITVCIEALSPCYCNFINHLEEAEKLRKAVEEPNLKLVADFYNMEYVGEADMDLSNYIPHLAHVHISDDEGSPLKRSYLKMEQKESHLSRLRHLRDAGYQNGTVTLEIDVPFDAAAAAQSLEILKIVD